MFKVLPPLLISFVAAAVLLIAGRMVWEQVETARILRERDLSPKVFEDAMNVATSVRAEDLELARKGKPSI